MVTGTTTMASRTSLADARRLQALADRLRPEVRREVELALRRIRSAVPLAQLEAALRSHDAFALHDLASRLPLLLQPAAATLEALFLRAGQEAVRKVSGLARIPIRFDSTNPFAQQAARQFGARLVREVTAETRRAIRGVVAEAFAEGVPPRKLARQVREIVGLTRRQALAVTRLQRQAVAEGLSRREAARRARRYADRLLRRRALVIARTEVIRSSNEGQLQAWREAVARRLVSGQSRKVWITTPDDRLCPFCRPMDGQAVALEAKFQTRLGNVTAPPLHPQCRCAIGLLPAAIRRAA